jgi:hypothetical protein
MTTKANDVRKVAKSQSSKDHIWKNVWTAVEYIQSLSFIQET